MAPSVVPSPLHNAAREERCQELQAAPGHLPREDTATLRAAVPASPVPPTAGEAGAHDGIPGAQGPLGEPEPIKRGVHSPETGLPPACRGHKGTCSPLVPGGTAGGWEEAQSGTGGQYAQGCGHPSVPHLRPRRPPSERTFCDASPRSDVKCISRPWTHPQHSAF